MPATAQHRILVVDDDRRMCGVLVRILADEGFAARAAHDGAAMRRLLADESFDLVLLDLRFPSGEDGMSLARTFRVQHDMPLVMLTGKDSTIDKVVCFELGADDYVTKPFEPRELIARLRAVLRRYGRSAGVAEGAAEDRLWAFSGWRLDPESQEVLPPEGGPIRLTHRECQVLQALLVRKGRILSREQILDIVASRNWSPYDRSIDVLIGRIRRKLRDDAGRMRFIRTVRGVGYMFVAQPGEDGGEEGTARGR
ncbi:response regulator [Paralimibaculum aggregatum]|uniref:Response regulator n=1 Tax=Paralimibaculum aggregatum TaxID=3036245 RepID=A0ABQ6LKC5_9RHOB|nr:response regulator transcription factor [Limibaculum sp. NKW23]GMG82685.1 response regulator [Limibaculum sp. NKW23]